MKRTKLGTHYAPAPPLPYRTALGDPETPAPPAEKPARRAPAASVCGPTKGTVRVCMERIGTPRREQITEPAIACNYLRNTADADRESFHVLMLDTRNRVINVEEVAKGTLTGVEVHPRETFKSAILSNAAGILLAHNHPSGDAGPSDLDIRLTERLAESGKILGIAVLDHVIVTTNGCTSLRDTHGQRISFGSAYKKPR